MSTPQEQPPAPGEPGAAPYTGAAVPPQSDGAPAVGAHEEHEEADTETEHAWHSRRDLYRHSPAFMLGRSARVGGSVVGGDQHGVSGGQVTGDVILGSKVEYHYGGDTEERSGEIPVAEVESLAAYFVRPRGEGREGRQDREGREDRQGREDREGAGDGGGDGEGQEADGPFGLALDALRKHRVVILSGPATTGRRAAALMLLREAGSRSYRALDPGLGAGRLAAELRDGCGHLVADFAATAERPLREHHLRALSERLHTTGGHLVLVTGPHPVVPTGTGHVPWRPPEPEALLAGHLRTKDLAGRHVAELLGLAEVKAVLAQHRPVAETARFADHVAGHARGTVTLAALGSFGHIAAERQVRAWFDSAEHTLHDKAFLIALATFDEAPYPLTAELGDVLYGLLQRIENPGEPARIPVFGTSSAQRVEQALAERYQEPEETEWGPVLQTKVQFRDKLTPLTLLREVWTGHPSARPALVDWLRRLADDPRPVVRTRAAATAAVMTEADLPSAMALLVRGWAGDRRLRARLAAANALALAHHLGAPHVSRILAEWCTAPDHRLRWTAVRAYALVGDAFPHEALLALTEAVRGMEARGGPVRGWTEEREDLAQSAAALLLAGGQEAAGRGDWSAAADLWVDLPGLARGTTRDFVLRAMVHACGPTDGPDGFGRPLLLDLLGRADPTPGTDGAALRQALAALWRSVLNDPVCSASGLHALRVWVRAADSDPGAEAALAGLLPLLAVSVEDHRRLAYLLENLRTEPVDAGLGAVPVAVALRLRAGLAGPRTPAASGPAGPSASSAPSASS
ncbi:hypothetical protein ACFQ8C_02345 [Streptomyces sp. NPDC056503]|uniref:hypothetical protein n=1 Tax=Streptomyces sp. NPDC056503 TaxID=3345842 RepID=UPI00368F9549